jgi:hypothetical protein
LEITELDVQNEGNFDLLEYLADDEASVDSVDDYEQKSRFAKH